MGRSASSSPRPILELPTSLGTWLKHINCRSTSATPPLDLQQATPIGSLTSTEISTLDTVVMLGGHVTASALAETAGIRPSAATNRLVNLDREGYLLRQPRGRRDGDLYIEPRSATATPIVCEEQYEFIETGTGTA